MATPYTGTSIVDYLKSTGGDASFGARAKIAAEKGITGYTGTAAQNIQLLGILRGGATAAPVATPTTTPPPVQSADEATTYLNDLQKSLSAGTPQVQSLEDIAASVKGALPASTVPAVPKLTEQYKQLRVEGGFDALETEITDMTAERDAIVAEARQTAAAEREKPVALGVIEGRVGEVERARNERLDAIDRQITAKTRVYEVKLKNIQTIMDLTGKDYELAKQDYDTKFNQSMSILSAVRGIRQEQLSETDKIKDNARADLQIMVNSLKDGNVSFDQLSPDQKLNINKLEVQAGLPVGFMSQIKKDPKADIVFTTSNEGITQVGVRNQDGTISVKSYGTRISPSDSDKLTAAQKAELNKSAIAAIEEADTNEDRQLSLAEYTQVVKQIMAETGADFATADDYATKSFTSLGYKQWGSWQ